MCFGTTSLSFTHLSTDFLSHKQTCLKFAYEHTNSCFHCTSIVFLFRPALTIALFTNPDSQRHIISISLSCKMSTYFFLYHSIPRRIPSCLHFYLYLDVSSQNERMFLLSLYLSFVLRSLRHLVLI